MSDLTIGIWEHTPGVSRDVEADEVFVVLSGDASVAFDDGSPTIELRPGSLVRLSAGQRTMWTVRETLRKVFHRLSIVVRHATATRRMGQWC